MIVADVRPFETAKLRMLNGAHSAIAYLGLVGGHDHVHEAVADPRIRRIVDQLMRIEAAATIRPVPGQDLQHYADALFGRFANAALPHRLRQIATDGSAKIGQRWLDPVAQAAREGRRSPATLTALAAWMLHVRGDRDPVDDPLASALAAAWIDAGDSGIVDALFGEGGLLAARWAASAEERAWLTGRIRALDHGDFAIGDS